MQSKENGKINIYKRVIKKRVKRYLSPRILKENFLKPSNPKKKEFIVYSDNRNFGFKVNRVHRRILELIKSENKDFIIHIGDFVFWDFGWPSFFKDLRNVGVNTLIFPVRGNHDNPLYFKRLFNMESLDYSLIYDDVLIIFIDDNANHLRKSQVEYVKQTLEKANNVNKIKWKIVILHKPLYSGAVGGVRNELINQLVPLFKKYGVQLSIGSHFHSYERLHIDGITYLVSAGGGAHLTNQHLTPPGLILHITTFNYLHIKVEENQLFIRVIDNDGKHIDKVEIKYKNH
ncbi:MAG: metallophosphoesterase [Candidatus Lokiarchaeota archaeon]|nr:metallophosphoesterase [Candidatus Harpocratesius repetitus]